MQLEPTEIPGCLRVRSRGFADERGTFLKTFSAVEFAAYGVDLHLMETFVNVSNKDVLRGLHFQLPPHDHDKVVWCLGGSALDVVVDLRRGSPAYGFASAMGLRADEPVGLLIPSGCAHGFLALEDATMIAYAVTSAHAPEHDIGIRWDSIGFRWPVSRPVVSERDAGLPAFVAFASPFVFEERR